MKHYFLGQAASFKIKKTLRFLFSFGTKQDFEKLKAELADKYHVKKEQVWLFHSGRTALSLSLLSQIPSSKKKDQTQPAVAITALTCYAVVQAVKTAGYQPVYLDIDPGTLHFSGKHLEDALKLHTNLKAVIIQNNLGIPSDVVEIEKIAKKHHLTLIEDLAHSVDIKYRDGRTAGQIGDAVVLSFGKGKSLDAISGGALILRTPQKNQLLSDSKIASRRPSHTDSLRDRFYPLFGLLSRGFSYFKIGKSDLGKLLTALLLKIHWIKRSADAELNFEHRLTFWQARFICREMEVRNKLQEKKIQPLLRQPFFVTDRAKVLKKLQAAGYYFHDIWYDTPVAPARYYKQSGFNPESCPVAVLVSKHLVNLPTHYSMPELSKARQIIYQSEIGIELNDNHPPEIKKKAYQMLEPQLDKANPSLITKTEQDRWKQTILRFPLANFLQSPKWKRYNQLLGHQVILREFSEASRILMVIKNAKRGRFMEISNGPLINWSDPRLVTLIFSDIYQAAKKHHCVFVRFRPAMIDSLENLKLIESLSVIPASFHLNAEHTVMIDLSKSESQLLADFRRQTRYEVRRAEKLGIFVVEKSRDDAILQEFHQTQLQTAKRQHFIPPVMKELKSLQAAFGDDLKLYVAYNKEQQPIAYGIILIDGEEADYYEAASTPLNYKLPGAYALQWQVIRDLKAQGLKRYNLWGIAPEGQKQHRYAGVTTFKTGFGPRLTYLHAHDIPIKKFRYVFNRLIENLRKKHRHLE